MKIFKSTVLIFLMVIGTSSCNEELITTDFEATNNAISNQSLKSGRTANMATGSVEIIWKGGGKGGEKGGEMGSEMGSQPENLRAFFEFNAHEAAKNKPAKGEVVFLVTAQDLTIHREIRANVLDVNFDDQNRSWFVARVISDSKGCNGGPSGEDHGSGCSGEDHTDGGCGDDTEHDGGCSGHETDTGGPGGEIDGGGCANDHTTDEGGCSGADHPDEGGQKPDVAGSAGKGNPLSGKNCRIGQLILVKVHDQATPGIFVDLNGDGKSEGDGLTWKWFASTSTYYLETTHNLIEVNNSVVHLCQKTIIAGNLVVHK